MHDRSFLTAHWSDILLLNFAVPADAIAALAPPGTEPDLHEGQALISVVGFRFHAVRLLGLAVPGHTRFPEINLRYYVRRTEGNETRRGVVFVREIVPRRAVAVTANLLYHEKYITRPMRMQIRMAGDELDVGDTLEYAWRARSRWPLTRRSQELHTNDAYDRLAARVASPFALPRSGSLEEFVVEHYWGYARGRDGRTREYKVFHPTWQVATADDIKWQCEVAATYDWPLGEYLTVPPVSGLIARGSAIRVFRGRRL
jgi:uncharacterized protein